MHAVLPVRGEDVQGSGAYGAPRGSRTHNGIDFACYPGTVVLPLFPGEVTKLGYPYADKLEFRYVQITDIWGNDHRYFYVDPCVVVGQKVSVHDPIGETQELPYEGITQHFHWEVKKDGKHIDPRPLLNGEAG